MKNLSVLLFAIFLFSSVICIENEAFAGNYLTTNSIYKPITFNEISIKPRKKSYKSKSYRKTVHVRGYHKKNGIYVHSYNRSAPHRRK